MADEKSFFDALAELDEELNVTGRNENDTNHDARLSNSETEGHEIGMSISLDYGRNVSRTSYSGETGVSSGRSTRFNIPGFRHSEGISDSHSVAGAEHIRSAASEESRTNSSLEPIAASIGHFFWTDNHQSNLPTQNYFERSIWRSDTQMEPQNASFRANINSCRIMESKAEKCFPEQKLMPSEVRIEREESGAVPQTIEDDREPRGTSAVLSPTEDVSSIKMDIGRASIGSVEGAKAVLIAGSPAVRTRSHRSGRVKRFKCEFCGKSFEFNSALNEHRRIHTGEKPFECDTCGKRFRRKHELKVHQLIHSDARPHACAECDQRFRQKYHLTTHLRTHTEEKTFSCDLCDKEFSRKQNLRAHIRTHTGEDPHQCELCRRDFGSKTNFMEHQKRDHGGK